MFYQIKLALHFVSTVNEFINPPKASVKIKVRYLHPGSKKMEQHDGG